MSIGRLIWIDFIKIMGIWLVVLGHFLPAGNVKVGIYSFHVPLFFIISGYVSEMRQRGGRLRIRQLLLPYLLWTVLPILMIMLLGWPAKRELSWQYALCQIVPVDGFGSSNQPTWFLYVLFFVELFMPVLSDWRKILSCRFTEVYGCYVLLFAFPLFVWLDVCCGMNLLAYRQVYLGCFFYLAGQIAYRFNLIEFIWSRKALLIPILICAIACAYFNGAVSIYGWVTGRLYLLAGSGVLLSICIMCGVRSLFSFQQMIRSEWVQNLIGSCVGLNLLILCTHYFLVAVYKKSVSTMFGADSSLAAFAATSVVLMGYYISFWMFRVVRVRWQNRGVKCQLS